MEQKKLGEIIAKYRMEKGMSQEKVAEYLEISRQAVTKWESNLSRPSSANLIKLAELFEISVDELLGNQHTNEHVSEANSNANENKKENVNEHGNEKKKADKMPWIFIGITLLCIAAYIVISSVNGGFRAGTLICMFILAVPIQLFLHYYITYAIENESFDTIAGFDSHIEYNISEVKKLLAQLYIHISILSTVCVFLLSMINCFEPELRWLNGGLLAFYVFSFIVCILINNYKAIQTLYVHEEDKKRASKGIPVTAAYMALLFIGIGVMIFLFQTKGIENNTLPAIKLAALLIVGMGSATIGYFVESNRIKKWKPSEQDYHVGKTGIICTAASIILFAVMFVV